MISSEQKEVFRILDFVGEQEADGLEALLASIHVVAQEQVVGLRRETTVLEQPQQIRVLPCGCCCC